MTTVQTTALAILSALLARHKRYGEWVHWPRVLRNTRVFECGWENVACTMEILEENGMMERQVVNGKPTVFYKLIGWETI